MLILRVCVRVQVDQNDHCIDHTAAIVPTAVVPTAGAAGAATTPASIAPAAAVPLAAALTPLPPSPSTGAMTPVAAQREAAEAAAATAKAAAVAAATASEGAAAAAALCTVAATDAEWKEFRPRIEADGKSFRDELVTVKGTRAQLMAQLEKLFSDWSHALGSHAFGSPESIGSSVH